MFGEVDRTLMKYLHRSFCQQMRIGYWQVHVSTEDTTEISSVSNCTLSRVDMPILGFLLQLVFVKS